MSATQPFAAVPAAAARCLGLAPAQIARDGASAPAIALEQNDDARDRQLCRKRSLDARPVELQCEIPIRHDQSWFVDKKLSYSVHGSELALGAVVETPDSQAAR